MQLALLPSSEIYLFYAIGIKGLRMTLVQVSEMSLSYLTVPVLLLKMQEAVDVHNLFRTLCITGLKSLSGLKP